MPGQGQAYRRCCSRSKTLKSLAGAVSDTYQAEWPCSEHGNRRTGANHHSSLGPCAVDWSTEKMTVG